MIEYGKIFTTTFNLYKGHIIIKSNGELNFPNKIVSGFQEDTVEILFFTTNLLSFLVKKH